MFLEAAEIVVRVVHDACKKLVFEVVVRSRDTCGAHGLMLQFGTPAKVLVVIEEERLGCFFTTQGHRVDVVYEICQRWTRVWLLRSVGM